MWGNQFFPRSQWTLCITAILFFVSLTLSALSQPLSPTLHDPIRLEELKKYYRERLVQIEYKVHNKLTDEDEWIRGNGFLVSPDGLAITARHVLEPQISDQYERLALYPLKITKSEGQATVQLELVDGSIKRSDFTDIAVFNVKAIGGAPLEYFCVNFDNIAPNIGDIVTTTAWQFYDLQSPAWQMTFNAASIFQVSGPGPLRQDWELTQPFHESMSGGAVLLGDRVAGVVSVVAMEHGKPVGYGNFAAALRYATDIGWERATRCGPSIPNPQNFRPYDSRQLFMSNSTEGDFAVFIPDGADGKYWTFMSDGNYSLRVKDLPCDPMCRCSADKPEKTVRLFINYSASKTCQAPQSTCLPGLGVRTFYGAQVVPIFSTASRDTRAGNPNTWLFKYQLYRRALNGSFVNSAPNKPAIWRTPSKFNEALADSEEIDRRLLRGCSSRLNSQECTELLGIEVFEDKFAPNWHGFPRKNATPRSTLFDSELKETWVVPRDWLGDDIEVKNWILPYKVTKSPSNGSPVNFAFCINSDWDGFYARAFSPERKIRTRSVHTFLDFNP